MNTYYIHAFSLPVSPRQEILVHLPQPPESASNRLALQLDNLVLLADLDQLLHLFAVAPDRDCGAGEGSHLEVFQLLRQLHVAVGAL